MNFSLVFTLGLAGLGIIAGGWLGWQLVRQNGRILLRLDELEKRVKELEFGSDDEPAGLTVGTEAPSFELPDLKGERKSLGQFRGQPTLIIFFNPDCGFCREMMPALAALPNPRGNGTPLPLVITTGDVAKNAPLFAEHKIDCPVLLQTDGEVAKAYQANGTPSGYLIGSEGKIASALALGTEAVMALAIAQPQSDQQPTDGGERASRFGNRSLARSKIQRDGLKLGNASPRN